MILITLIIMVFIMFAIALYGSPIAILIYSLGVGVVLSIFAFKLFLLPKDKQTSVDLSFDNIEYTDSDITALINMYADEMNKRH